MVLLILVIHKDPDLGPCRCQRRTYQRTFYLASCLLSVGSEDPSTCNFLQAPAKSNHALTIDTMGRKLPCRPLFQSFSRLGTLFPSSFVGSVSHKRQVFKRSMLRKTKKKEQEGRKERKWIALLHRFFPLSPVFLLPPISVIDPFNTYLVSTVYQTSIWGMEQTKQNLFHQRSPMTSGRQQWVTRSW